MDYLLGAPQFRNAQGITVGRVVLVDGATGLILNGALAPHGLPPDTFEGAFASEFGEAVTGLGDLDGDGFGEFAVGIPAPSVVLVYGGLNPAGLFQPCASGTVNEPVLFIDGSSGGATRFVSMPINTPFTLSMVQPTTSLSPANFAIAGYLDVALVGQETVLPFNLGTLCLPPAGVDPASFILTNNYAPFVSQIIPSTPTPWSTTNSTGLPFPFHITFQGVITVAPGDLRITNALVLEITP